jgi:hypothetical protein
MTDTTKALDYSFASTAKLLRACLKAMNMVPNTRIDLDIARDTYALASHLTAYIQHASSIEHGEKRGEPAFSLEVRVHGLIHGDEDEGWKPNTVADCIADAIQWDVDLMITLDCGRIEALIEREYASKEEADEVAQKMLRLFPTASLSQVPER